MWDTRDFKGGMREENREAGPGYAPFGRRDHYLAPVKSHSMLNLSPLQIVERK